MSVPLLTIAAFGPAGVHSPAIVCVGGGGGARGLRSLICARPYPLGLWSASASAISMLMKRLPHTASGELMAWWASKPFWKVTRAVLLACCTCRGRSALEGGGGFGREGVGGVGGVQEGGGWGGDVRAIKGVSWGGGCREGAGSVGVRTGLGFQEEIVHTALVHRQWGNLFEGGESETGVPLLTCAGSTPQRPSHCGAGNASRGVGGTEWAGAHPKRVRG